MAPETELLLTLCCTPHSAEAHSRASILVEGPIDWKGFFSEAASWQVEPVVMSNLRLHHFAAIPADVLRQVTLRERDSRAIALSRTLMMMELQRAFNGAALPVLVLKGPAVAVTAYADASLRTFGDMDFVVRRENLRDARDILKANGFVPDYDTASEPFLIEAQHALEFSGARAKVELHSALLSRHLRLNFTDDDVWHSSVTITCAGSTARVLAPHVQLMFLCAHGAKHEWMSLRWICDIAQLAARLELSEVESTVNLAGRLNARRLLALALRLAAAVFPGSPSRFPDHVLGSDAATQRLVNLVLSRLGLAEFREQPLAERLGASDPAIRTIMFWSRARERRVDQVASVTALLFGQGATGGNRSILRRVSRTARLAARALGRPSAPR